MTTYDEGGFAAMPFCLCSGLSRGRVRFLVTLCLAAVFSVILITAASAQSLKAYKASGSLVFKTDGGSVSNAHGATIGKIEGAAGPDDPATIFLASLLLGII